VRRAFFAQSLRLSLALGQDVYAVPEQSAPVSSYLLPYIEQQVALDLRDDARRARSGFYAAITAQQAVRLNFGSWRYLRLLPELRAYQPLPLNIVLAQRFALGALLVGSAASELDPTSRRLGPQEYRLRGGGANSNRGFEPGRLGAGIDGGLRRWEGSIEARIPLSSDFGFVVFFDVGDVHDGTRFRFLHWNASAGFGLRYFSLVVPVRLDLGWRIPGGQVIAGAEPDVGVAIWPTAAHLTIGEAY
jgi:outer membrane translocation and assembly module TamA